MTSIVLVDQGLDRKQSTRRILFLDQDIVRVRVGPTNNMLGPRGLGEPKAAFWGIFRITFRVVKLKFHPILSVPT